MIWYANHDGVTITFAWPELKMVYRIISRGAKGGFYLAFFRDICNRKKNFLSGRKP